MSKGYLIGGFKAIGKTTLARKYENVIDLESSDYQYLLDDNLKEFSKEERKGRKDRVKNPEYPMNYINEMISLKNQGKIVLFACKKEIILKLDEKKEKYYIIYPKKEMLDEIVERCKNRGNNDDFINNINNAYERDYPQKSENTIWIENNQYLEEVLIKRGILK